MKRFLFLLVLLVCMPIAFAHQMAMQGNVFDDGAPTSDQNIRFEIFDAATGGNLIYNSTNDFDGTVIDGKFDVVLGSGSNTMSLVYGLTYYMDMIVNGTDLDFDGSERQSFISTTGNITTDSIPDGNLTTAKFATPPIDGSGASGELAFFSDSDTVTSSDNLTWDSTNRRLGINTTTPIASLDVRGNASFDGDTFFIDHINNRIGFGTDNPLQPVHFDLRGVGNDIVLQYEDSASGYGEFAWTDDTGDKWTLGVLADSYSDTPLQNAWFLYQLRDSSNSVLNTYRLVVNDDGYLGVGDTYPYARLSVSGNGSITQNLSVGDNISASGVIADEVCIGGSCQTSWPTGIGGSGSAPRIPVFSDSNTLANSNIRSEGSEVWVDANTTVNGTLFVQNGTQNGFFVVNSTDSKVAIGATATTTDAEILQVFGGNILVDAGAGTDARITTASASNGVETALTSGGTAGWAGTTTNAAFALRAFNLFPLWVTSGGLVGINTTVGGPDTNLHVRGGVCIDDDEACTDPGAGNISVRQNITASGLNVSAGEAGYGIVDADEVCIGGNCQTAWPSGSIDGSGAADHVAYWTDGDTIAHDENQLYWDASNNYLGIGVAVPDTELTVNTTVDFDNTSSNSGQDNIFLYGTGTEQQYAYGGSIGFGRISGSSDVRRAAIAAIQASSDPDNMGLSFWTHDSTSASPLNLDMTITNGGVGINGVRVAQSELQVNGSICIAGSATCTDPGEGNLFVEGDLSSTGPFTIDSTSYVRVGDAGTPETATADDDLYVEGNFESDGDVYVDGGNLLVGSWVSSAAAFSVNDSSSNMMRFPLDYSGTFGFLSSDAAILVLDGDTAADGAGTVYRTNTLDWFVGVDDATSGNFRISDEGVTNVLVSTLGNMDVLGRVNSSVGFNASPNGYVDANMVCIGGDCQTSWPSGSVDGSGAADRLAFWSDGDTLTSDANLYYDSTNEELGIGVASPSFLLAVGSSGGTASQGVANFDTDTGSDPFYVSRTGDVAQALNISVDDSNVIFRSEQDEDDLTRGGFFFNMDDDGTQTPSFIVEVKSGQDLLTVESDGDTIVYGDLALFGYDITSDSSLTLNASSYVRVGDTGTPGSASGVDDLYIEGDVEVDGVLYADGNSILGPDDGDDVGIGTAAVPHGGIGYAKVAIDGASSSATGPHVQYTTTASDYPVRQDLHFTHDNFALGIDSYYDGAWRSSDAGSNYQLRKNGDIFTINYDSAVAQGGAITWTAGIALDTSGHVGIGMNAQDTELHVLGGACIDTDTTCTDPGAGELFVANNIGIGIDPSFTLDVEADDSTTIGVANFDTDSGSDPFYITRSGTVTENLNISVDDNNVNFYSEQDEGSGAVGGFIFNVDEDGTQAPVFRVQTKGGTYMATVNHTGSLQLEGDITVGGNNIIAEGPLLVRATTSYTGIGDGSASPGSASGIEDLFVEGDLEVDGTIYADGGISGLPDGSGASDRVTLWSDSDTVTYDDSLVWDSGNDLGIGVADPLYTLDVNSSARVTAPNGATLYIDADDGGGAPAATATIQIQGYEGRAKGIFITDEDDTHEFFMGEAYSGVGLSLGYDDTTGGQSEYPANAKVWVDATSGGFVGINNTAPDTDLHIRGGLCVDTDTTCTDPGAGDAFIAGTIGIQSDPTADAGIYIGGDEERIDFDSSGPILDNELSTSYTRMQPQGDILILYDGGTNDQYFRAFGQSGTDYIELRGNNDMSTIDAEGGDLALYGNDAMGIFIEDTTGFVGIDGIGAPNMSLDIPGSATNGRAMRIRSGDGSTGTDSRQIVFSYDNGLLYSHGIGTRHNSGAAAGNAIDFYVWDQGTDATNSLGSNVPFTISDEQGGSIGVNNLNPDTEVHIDGGVCIDTDDSCTDPGDGNLYVEGDVEINGAFTYSGGNYTGANGEYIEVGTTDGSISLRADPDSLDHVTFDLDTGSYPEIECNVDGSTTYCEFPGGVYASGSNPIIAAQALYPRGYIRNDDSNEYVVIDDTLCIDGDATCAGTMDEGNVLINNGGLCISNADGCDGSDPGDGNIVTVGNYTTSGASRPSIVLDSGGSGDNWYDQGAFISLGESAIVDSGAALYLSYVGNGYSYIGSGGGISTDGIPDQNYFRFDYNDNEVYFNGELGVGAAAPDAELHVAGGVCIDTDDSCNDPGSGYMYIENGLNIGTDNGATMTGAYIDVNKSVDSTAAIVMQNHNSGTSALSGFLAYNGDSVSTEYGGILMGGTGYTTVSAWQDALVLAAGSDISGGVVVYAGSGTIDLDATTYVRVGDSGTPGLATGSDDLYVEGDFEVDADATIAAQLGVGTTPHATYDIDAAGTINAGSRVRVRGGAALYAPNGNKLEIGSTGTDDYVTIVGDAGTVANFTEQGYLYVGDGGSTPGTASAIGDLFVEDDLEIDGDFYGSGSDLAEIFVASEASEPGDILSIGNDGSLTLSATAYDTTVAGIHTTDPGIILGSDNEGTPVALSGQVPVKVTDENGAITPGDLLTTSSTPGHAMRCNARSECFGAIVGKALDSHEEGMGKITALVILG